jgi:opacity protein-like surface antigen
VTRKIIGWLAGACLALHAAVCIAEGGFYAGIDAGVVEADAKPSDGFQVYATGFPISVLPETTRVQGSDLGWTGFFGYRMNRFLAAELGYAGFGSVDIEETYDLSEFSPPLPPETTLPSSSEVGGLTFSVLGLLPFSQDRFEAFVRAGVLFADQTLKGDLGVASGVEFDESDELWLAGAGLSFRPTPRWSTRIEYQAVEELRANTMTGAIEMWRVSLGIAYYF